MSDSPGRKKIHKLLPEFLMQRPIRPGLILFVNHDYFYSIEIFFNQKLFCNRRFLRLKLFLFLFDYFSRLPVIVINLTNKL